MPMHPAEHHHTAYSNPEFWIPYLLLSVAMVLYTGAAAQQYRRGKSWNGWRTALFCSGIALLAIAFWPSLQHWGHQSLQGHMVQHLLIGMLAPIGLVLAAPLSLLLRSIDPAKGRRLTAILAGRPLHYLGHPVSALLLNIGGMALLYLTPLYGLMHQYPLLHWVLHVHFLLAGCLFVWAIAGPDPAPRRPGLRLRFVVLFLSAFLHAYLSKAMFAYQFPRNTHHSLQDIEAAAKLMYYGGDAAELLLAIAFFSIWYRTKGRRSRALRPASI